MEYKTFNKRLANSTVLTGVRNANKCSKSKKVYLTGYYKINGVQTGFVYKGSATNSDLGIFHPIKFPNSYLTSPYGPDRISESEISVVGNYNLGSGSPSVGFLYTGPWANTDLGTWISIVPPFVDAVNCIMHSVMKGIAVGNYGLNPSLINVHESKIHALLFNSKTNQYQKITYPGVDSISAYGIWHNQGTSYTITGGYIKNKKNRAYIVDWDSSSGKFSNWQSYKFNNSNKATGTHFDGITGISNGVYNLTGNYLDKSGSFGFFCTVNRNKNRAIWTTVNYPESTITSGNTIIDNKVYGVFAKNGKVNAYVYEHDE